jgi:hypothetical protein
MFQKKDRVREEEKRKRKKWSPVRRERQEQVKKLLVCIIR